MEENLIEEIRRKIDLIEIVSQYVQLKRQGVNMVGLCPFHSERTPSFYVSPRRQLWHCFGCGAGGNVFHFLMKIENISFWQALQDLAKKAGVKLPSMAAYEKREDNFYDINELACNFFEKCLWETSEGEEARSYLENRGVTTKSAKNFRLGFAPGGNKLKRYLTSQRIDIEEAMEAGLLIKREEILSDFFYNRIIFPVFNVQGKIIAFGGRSLGSEMPKYLNTRDTRVFHKSKSLYGINFARRQLANTPPILVEGYFDVISLHQYGFTTALAPLGTALTEEQAYLLSRYNSEVIIAFDGDEAGIKATSRSVQILDKFNLSVSVIPLPQGSDPDEYIREKGQEAFERLYKERKDFFTFLLKLLVSQIDISTIKGKEELLKKILPFVINISNPVQKDEYFKKLASALSLNEQSIRSYCSRLKLFAGEPKKKDEVIKLQQEYPKIELELLGAIIFHPEIISVCKEEFVEEDFTEPLCKKLFIELVKEEKPLNSLWPKLTQQEASFLSQIFFKEELFSSKENLFIYIERFKRNKLLKRLKEIELIQEELNLQYQNLRLKKEFSSEDLYQIEKQQDKLLRESLEIAQKLKLHKRCL